MSNSTLALKDTTGPAMITSFGEMAGKSKIFKTQPRKVLQSMQCFSMWGFTQPYL